MPFDPTRESQLTDKDLSFGYWWVTHKVRARRVATVMLAVAGFALVGYGAYGFIDWFVGTGVNDRIQTAMLALPYIDYAGIHVAQAPQQPRIDAPLVLASGNGTYDVAARVQNPNGLWWLEFDYRFDGADGIAPRHGFLLPGDAMYFDALGLRGARPTPSQLVLENVIWHRVNLHETRPDYLSWSAARLGLTVKGVTFITPVAGDAVPVWRATFDVQNGTAFGYYRMGFQVTLLSGNRVVGINDLTVSNLRPGETRTIDATWFSTLPTVTKVDVKPTVNVFDQSAYIPAGK